MKFYRGIFLLESLKHPKCIIELPYVEIVKIEKKIEPTSTKDQPNIWTWYSIIVPQNYKEKYVLKISSELKSRGWYTNLWCDGDYFLIFPNKYFHNCDMKEESWTQAIDYALSIAIPIEQLVPLEHILRSE